MAFRKISSPTLKELFMEEMESMILSGELAIGDKLPSERDIAQQMQISRSVVNDGIVELARKGFLNILPRQGTYVADYKKYGTIDTLIAIMKNGNVSNDYIRSTLVLRSTFMDLALDSAIPNLQDEDMEALKHICQQFQHTKDAHKAADIIFQFDHLLMTCSNNLLLPLLFSSFKIPNELLFERYFRLHGIAKMDQRNMRFLEYAQRKDVEGAKRIMRDSIQETLDGSTKIYAENA